MTTSPHPTFSAPEVPRDAAKAYGEALSALFVTEQGAPPGCTLEQQRQLLEMTDRVLACRVQLVRALLDSGVRLPREELARLHVDEELLALPPSAHQAWLPSAG